MTCDLLCSYFQLPESTFKVEGLLSQQETSDTTKLGGKHRSLQHVKTWSLDYIKPKWGKVRTLNRFTVSES